MSHIKPLQRGGKDQVECPLLHHPPALEWQEKLLLHERRVLRPTHRIQIFPSTFD
jgi:hypothetical protein